MKSFAIRASTVDPYSSPNTPFQYHREYGAASNPTGIVPGNYELTVQAKVNGHNVSKTVFFNVDTCDFNQNILVDF